MKRFILLLVFCLLASPCLAYEIKENFQDWSIDPNIAFGHPGGSTGSITLNSPTGNLYYHSTGGGASYTYLQNTVINPMGYAATDIRASGNVIVDARASDGLTSLYSYTIPGATLSPTTWKRIEFYVDAFTPKTFVDGVNVNTGAPLFSNPSFVFIYGAAGVNPDYDNVLYAVDNTHTTSPPPVNWTIVRDFLNPAATGVYALDAAGTSYVLQDSQAFYVTAISSTLGAAHPLTESFRLYKADGTVVNSTSFDATSYRIKQIAYPISNSVYGSASFFNNPAVTDGLYYAAFDNFTPNTQDYFFVTSSGGFINFDKSSYIVGDPGTITWSISAAYYTPTTHTYQYAIKDIYGNTVHSSTITSATGSDTITFDAATYAQGVYYVYLEATTKSVPTTTSILGTDSMTLLDYTTFHGTVYDALTTLPLPGALVNFSQLGTVQQVTVPASAEYSMTGFVTGSRINISVTNAGYAEYNYTFVPLRNVNVSLDFALVPLPTNATGVGIGGVARELTYGQLIPSASITVFNVTAGTSYVRTANSRGYYQCSYAEACVLSRNREYTVFGRKTGYADSANYLVVVT